MTTALADQQLAAWGVLVHNSNTSAAHLANGLVQVMRLYPSLCASPLEVQAGAGYASSYTQAIETRLTALALPGGWKLSPAARALCVTKTKQGPATLQAPPKGLEEAVAGLRARLGGTLPSQEAHEAIAAALNADRRVYIDGGADPTTPGLSLAGYTSTHTIKTMCAATLVSALSSVEAGREALGALYALLADERIPQAALVKVLDLGAAPPTSPLPPCDAPVMPLPSADAAWGAEADRLATLYKNLLSWRGRALPDAETLMAVVDLLALTVGMRLLRWSACGPLPLVSPLGHAYSDRAAITYAQRSFAACLLQLRERSEAAKLSHEKTSPDKYVRNMLQTTGWLTPRNSQGGAKQALWPAARQLTTLTLSLMGAGEGDLSWEVLRKRGIELLHIDLGGEPREAGSTDAAQALRRAAALNQEQLVALGLARRESDNVIRIDGGMR